MLKIVIQLKSFKNYSNFFLSLKRKMSYDSRYHHYEEASSDYFFEKDSSDYCHEPVASCSRPSYNSCHKPCKPIPPCEKACPGPRPKRCIRPYTCGQKRPFLIYVKCSKSSSSSCSSSSSSCSSSSSSCSSSSYSYVCKKKKKCCKKKKKCCKKSKKCCKKTCWLPPKPIYKTCAY